MSRWAVPLRILVTGAGGQLGLNVVRELRRGGHEVAALTRAALDLTQREPVLERLSKLRPQAIVNTSAFGVEQSEEDPKSALAVNAFAVRTLAEACRNAGATLVHFSSDFVFDGTATSPYRETDRPNPGNVYGATKLLGEWYAAGAPRHFVLRVESLFGNPEGRSTIVRMCVDVRAGRAVSAFYDRTVSPAYMVDVAAVTRRLLEGKAASGVYHCVNAGFTTWHELALELTRQIGSPSSVAPVSADSLASKVFRPKFAALSNEKLANLGIELPSWQNALARALAAPPPSATPIPTSGIRPTSSRG
ncbi:MAG: dTDP-4-dehydrorhamnose reductase [Acidobacteriota bacterium]